MASHRSPPASLPPLPRLPFSGEGPQDISPAARRRVFVEALAPRVDGGRYPVKRVVGDRVSASCDLVRDGQDAVAGALLVRRPAAREWLRQPLQSVAGERYEASFLVDEIGQWQFAILAWIDPFETWRAGTRKKIDAGQDVELDLAAGALLLKAYASRADAAGADTLRSAAARLEDGSLVAADRWASAASPPILAAVAECPDLRDATQSEPVVIVVDPVRARFSSWYEMFPRSAGAPGRHGTLRDVAARLPYVASLGFDVLYLPPIHPIGRTARKGPNNAPNAGPDDVGSPWAIGGPEGGHKSVHPRLGTIDDLQALVRKARELGIEVALDIALQASPDHPYVTQHPEWFLHRPDGTIQYAENPPKRYEDVYPFDFYGAGWESLWEELHGIFVFWCEKGVRVFRVDNPHTKPLAFWEWCIARVKAAYPDALFLAEAFTRPKLMYALAKLGFTQSYTYFTWRQSKRELTDYVTTLARPPLSDFYRPNFWPNTPDILPTHLEFGNRAAFVQRLVLAATLSSNYGIYGPAFELMDRAAREGAEEYADNEKYQIRSWDLQRQDSLGDLITLVNRVRRENPALQDNLVTFHPTDDDALLAFSKRSADGAHVVLVVVNLDSHHRHAGHVALDLAALGVGPDEAFQAHDLLSDERHRFQGPQAYVELDPEFLPASVFAVRRHLRTEQDFDYYS
ncbi:MAG TPA: alpha-1,4-glucan--maltose-1-phosphate maltosyltransferase [Polyangiaceae bacterium]|jgi:starch synthase (maltosyl-transferring)